MGLIAAAAGALGAPAVVWVGVLAVGFILLIVAGVLWVMGRDDPPNPVVVDYRPDGRYEMPPEYNAAGGYTTDWTEIRRGRDAVASPKVIALEADVPQPGTAVTEPETPPADDAD